MSEHFDVIVLGVGGMGSAALYHLARRGLRVLGVERCTVPHEMGSSHGGSRVIRKAYFEDPRYVPLLHRAYELWRRLETDAGEQLMHLCGGINIGPADHGCIRGVIESASQHGLAHERLDAPEIRRRFPCFEPANDEVGVFEADAGYLVPEHCILAHVAAAQRHGAALRPLTTIDRITPRSSGVELQTPEGSLSAAHLVLTAGAWLGGLLGRAGVRLPLSVERQVQLWFEPLRPGLFTPDRMPVFIRFGPGHAHYGIPAFGEHGVKVCRHHGGPRDPDPDTVDRTVSAGDEGDVREFLRRFLPAADGPLRAARVCLYTNAPDDHFIIGAHPSFERALIVSPCSGHGFKFCPVIGEIVADLVVDGRTRHDIAMFSPQRFMGSGRGGECE